MLGGLRARGLCSAQAKQSVAARNALPLRCTHSQPRFSPSLVAQADAGSQGASVLFHSQQQLYSRRSTLCRPPAASSAASADALPAPIEGTSSFSQAVLNCVSAQYRLTALIAQDRQAAAVSARAERRSRTGHTHSHAPQMRNAARPLLSAHVLSGLSAVLAECSRAGAQRRCYHVTAHVGPLLSIAGQCDDGCRSPIPALRAKELGLGGARDALADGHRHELHR